MLHLYLKSKYSSKINPKFYLHTNFEIEIHFYASYQKLYDKISQF